MSINMTEAAAKHIQRHLGNRGSGVGVRLGVRLTGCSGMAYQMDFVDEVPTGDEVLQQHGATLFIDPKCLPFIDGTQIDYRREGLNGRFFFDNPNEKASCGCGESFTV